MMVLCIPFEPTGGPVTKGFCGWAVPSTGLNFFRGGMCEASSPDLRFFASLANGPMPFTVREGGEDEDPI